MPTLAMPLSATISPADRVHGHRDQPVEPPGASRAPQPEPEIAPLRPAHVLAVPTLGSRPLGAERLLRRRTHVDGFGGPHVEDDRGGRLIAQVVGNRDD